MCNILSIPLYYTQVGCFATHIPKQSSATWKPYVKIRGILNCTLYLVIHYMDASWAIADYTREKTSDFYKENFSERYDNPVFKLPPYENGEHTHELRGLAKKKAENH